MNIPQSTRHSDRKTEIALLLLASERLTSELRPSTPKDKASTPFAARKTCNHPEIIYRIMSVPSKAMHLLAVSWSRFVVIINLV